MCIGYDPFPEALPFAVSAVIFGTIALGLFVFELIKKTKKNSIKYTIIAFVLLAILSALIWYYRINIAADFVRC